MIVTLGAVAVADAPIIAALYRESFTQTFGHLYAAEDLAEFLSGKTAAAFADELADPAYRFRMARDETGEALGFAKLGPPDLPVETPPATIELRQIYVLERATGSGVGALLMAWVMETARDAQARHLQLSVYVDNHRARRFYAKRGFIEIASYHFMVGKHADHDIVMRLAL